MCNLDELLIDITDFNCIKDVTEHCTINHLCEFIREAQDLHLSNKIGWELLDILINDQDNEDYTDLLCGSMFDYCDQKEKHFGLKRVLVHYAYAIKVRNSNYHDTSTGTVFKLTQDSSPVSDEILERLKIEHFNLANKYWKMTEKYLCANKETFTSFNSENCNCGCNNEKENRVNSRLKKAVTFKRHGNNNNHDKRCDSLHDECGCNCC